MLGIARDVPGECLRLEEEVPRRLALVGSSLLFVLLIVAWGIPLPLLAYTFAVLPGGVADLFIEGCIVAFATLWYASMLGATRVLARVPTRARSLEMSRESGASVLEVDRAFRPSVRRVAIRLQDIRRIALEGRPARKGSVLLATIEAASPSPHRERFRLHVAEVDAHDDAKELLSKMSAIAGLGAARTEHDDPRYFVIAAVRGEAAGAEQRELATTAHAA